MQKKKNNKAAVEQVPQRLALSGVVLVGCIAALVLAQGGFFGLPTCTCGIVACLGGAIAWLRKTRRGSVVPAVVFFSVGLTFAYLLSALVNGATLTTLAETGAWAAFAGALALSAAQGEGERRWTLRTVTWLGVATAVLGMLVFCGLLPLRGGMVEDRLQFSFQYANAAAAWYGAMTFLCLLSPDRRLRSMVVVPAVALLMTASGGGLLVFALVAAALGAWWTREAEWGLLLRALLEGVCALALFVAFRMVPNPASVLLVPLTVAVGLALDRRASALPTGAPARRYCLTALGALAVLVVVGIVLLHTRAAEAFATFVERFYHMADGLRLWMCGPLLGIGPDNWQYQYQDVQSAQYYTTVIHSSYVQALVDAGLLGFGLLCGACACGVRSLARTARENGEAPPWERATLFATCFVLGHALIDFDLQFGSLAFLTGLLLGRPAGEKAPTSEAKGARKPVAVGPLQVRGLAVGIALTIACLPVAVLGMLCSASSTALTLATQSGDYATCERMYLDNALAHGDGAARDAYAEALYSQGKNQQLISHYKQFSSHSDSETLYVVLALYAIQDSENAGLVLVDRMEAQPYNREFFRSAKRLVDAYGLSAQLVDRYNAAVDRSNELAAGASSLLPEQEQLDVYVTSGA